jgi:hypothetical protein
MRRPVIALAVVAAIFSDWPATLTCYASCTGLR